VAHRDAARAAVRNRVQEAVCHFGRSRDLARLLDDPVHVRPRLHRCRIAHVTRHTDAVAQVSERGSRGARLEARLNESLSGRLGACVQKVKADERAVTLVNLWQSSAGNQGH
jgi:hypothetical protein